MKLPLPAWLQNRRLRLVWRVEKPGAPHRHYLAGTAHFFPYSYARPLRRLLRRVQSVVFEGPLDETSMARIAAHGRQGDGTPRLPELLSPQVIATINRRLAESQAQDDLTLLLAPSLQPDYFSALADGARPWMAFFSICTAYLGWPYSVDMEAFQLAHRLGKDVYHLETMEEQLAVLDGIPLERVLAQLNDVDRWDEYRDQFERHFLAGDIERLVGMSGRFPTRVPMTISARDRLMSARLLPLLEQAPTAAFVGMPHIPGVCAELQAAGYQTTQEPF